MTRPIYESEDDGANEAAVAQLIAVHFVVRVVKAPKLAPIDWEIYRNDVLGGLLEVKCRTHRPGTFPTLILSEMKWLEGIRLGKEKNVPFYVAASFGGDVRWINACRARNFYVDMAGRTDRDDPMDMERCVHIPMDNMKRIKL